MIYILKDLVKIKYGKNQKDVENPNGKYPIYGTGGLMTFSDEYLYDKPSVLIGRKGSISKVKYCDHPFWTVDTLFYTEINEELVLPKYLYYKLSTIDFNNYNEGTTIPSLRTDTLYRIELDIPEKKIQQRIVRILDSIENKIKLNNNMNLNLNNIGESLYKQYFVNKDFTDRYERKKLSDVTTNNRIKIDQNKEYKVLSAINTGELILSDDYFNKQVYSKNIEKYLNVNKNDFAYNPARINIGSIGINKYDFPCCVSPVYVTFSVDEKYINYFEYYFKSERFNSQVKMRASGSVRQTLNYNDFGLIEIDYPNIKQVMDFNEKYAPVKMKIDENNKQVLLLNKIMDALLPKLINGDIDLDDIDI